MKAVFFALSLLLDNGQVAMVETAVPFETETACTQAGAIIFLDPEAFGFPVGWEVVTWNCTRTVNI